jgi:hypothetical protein
MKLVTHEDVSQNRQLIIYVRQYFVSVIYFVGKRVLFDLRANFLGSLYPSSV